MAARAGYHLELEGEEVRAAAPRHAPPPHARAQEEEEVEEDEFVPRQAAEAPRPFVNNSEGLAASLAEFRWPASAWADSLVVQARPGPARLRATHTSFVAAELSL
jgi:hypothetical protein